MVEKSCFKVRLAFKHFLLALILALITINGVHAVLQNHKLSGVNAANGDVNSFKISPDGKFTIFRGDLRAYGKLELFSVPTTGGARVTLSKGLSTDCEVNRFLISPNSETVVYSALSSTGESCGLFSVPIGGGTPIELHPREAGFFLRDINITFNNENVIYIVEQISDPPQAMIHQVPIGGGEIELLSYVCEGELDYLITPDSQHIVFRYYTITGVSQLKISTMNGEQEELIFSSNHISQYSISLDGAYIVYLEEISGKKELFSIPFEGNTASPLNGDLLAGGEVLDFEIAPNSDYVVYLADETTHNQYLLYQAPIDGSATGTPLIPPSMIDPNENVSSFSISPDSQWVVYRGDFRVDERFELFSVSIADGVNFCLTPTIIDDGDVSSYQITPNSLGVVFIADRLTDEVDELFGVFINGLGIRRLNDTLPDGGEVSSFMISPNSQGVVYRADQSEYDVYNLYAIPTLRRAGVMPLQINPELVLGGDVDYHYAITPDNKGVVYIADQEIDEFDELFITYDYQTLYLPLIVN